MSLIAELKRRNVVRMARLYLVGAWLIAQVAETVLPMFGARGPWREAEGSSHSFVPAAANQWLQASSREKVPRGF
jgi:hypothetical protein